MLAWSYETGENVYEHNGVNIFSIKTDKCFRTENR